MSTAVAKREMPVEEYLALHTEADEARYEYLDAYLNLDSLQEYWIFSPSQVLLMQYVHRGDEWIVRSVRGRDSTVHPDALGVDIPIETIYALVEPDDPEDADETLGEDA